MQMTKPQSLRDELGSALLLRSSILIFIIIIIRTKAPADGMSICFFFFFFYSVLIIMEAVVLCLLKAVVPQRRCVCRHTHRMCVPRSGELMTVCFFHAGGCLEELEEVQEVQELEELEGRQAVCCLAGSQSQAL